MKAEDDRQLPIHNINPITGRQPSEDDCELMRTPCWRLIPYRSLRVFKRGAAYDFEWAPTSPVLSDCILRSSIRRAGNTIGRDGRGTD